MLRNVRDAARRAAEAEPARLRYERATGVTDERVVIIRSPEAFDRRGRTQGYQACGAGALAPRRRAEIPGQIDLFSELDEAERAATEEESDNSGEGGGDAEERPSPARAWQAGQQEAVPATGEDGEAQYKPG